jgi:hypothetical protein
MPHCVDIVVLSNIKKPVPPGVALLMGLPTKDPWSLPFGHKKLFADRCENYDLFIYSEDDMLITEKNISSFLQMTAILQSDEIAGFLRIEKDSGGSVNYPEMHGYFHWDPQSVRLRAGHVFAFFTCEHSACYVLTREQLKRAIDSGNFLVEPHHGKYDLLCSAATDPYTQCGFQKLICISQIDDFLVHHLPNKYIGTRFGVEEREFRRQVSVLFRMAMNGKRPVSLFNAETKLPEAAYSKNYYEPARQELSTMIPGHVRTVLSIGCGWGATEAWLAEKGLRVTAVPLDPVIPGRAEDAGVEVVQGDFAAVRNQLSSRRFDCLLLLNVLHLVDDPVAFLGSFKGLLSRGAPIVSLVPNMARKLKPRTKAGREQDLDGISYQIERAHFVSHEVVGRWFDAAGAEVTKTVDILTPRAKKVSHLTFRLADSLLSSEFFSIAEAR